MRKTRRVLMLLLAVTLILALVACGGNNNTPNNAPDTNAPMPNAPGSSPSPSSPSAPAPGSNAPAESQPPVDNTVYEFKFACDDPKGAAISNVMDAWAADILEASNGRLNIVIYYGGVLGAQSEQLNMLEQGSIDFCTVGMNHAPGRSPFTEVFNIPALQYKDPMQVAKALDYMLKNNSNIADEIKNVKVIGYRTSMLTPIGHKGAPWKTLADMKGVAVNASSLAVTAFVSELGMVPVNVPLPDRYEGLSKGVISAVTSDWNALNSFSLIEQIDSIMDTHVTIQVNFVSMSWAAWNKLPADLQDILMERSGQLAQDFCNAWDDIMKVILQQAKDLNVQIYDTPPEIETAMVTAGEAAKQAYIEYLQGKSTGVDCAAYVAEVQAALDRFKS